MMRYILFKKLIKYLNIMDILVILFLLCNIMILYFTIGLEFMDSHDLDRVNRDREFKKNILLG